MAVGSRVAITRSWIIARSRGDEKRAGGDRKKSSSSARRSRGPDIAGHQNYTASTSHGYDQGDDPGTMTSYLETERQPPSSTATATRNMPPLRQLPFATSRQAQTRRSARSTPTLQATADETAEAQFIVTRAGRDPRRFHHPNPNDRRQDRSPPLNAQGRFRFARLLIRRWSIPRNLTASC